MKKIISLFIAIVMVLSLFLASCSEKEETKTQSGNKTNSSQTNAPVTNAPVIEGDVFAERAAVADDLPDTTFGGKQFRVVGHMRSEYYVNDEDINKGDLIKDAKHKRDTIVEERFDIEIVPTFSGTYMEVNEWVSKSVLSGIDEFDLLVNQAVDSGSLVLKNLFLNWYDIPNVDFSKPWWAKSTSEDLTYDGKCVLAISDYNSSAMFCTRLMVFNKNLANAYDLGNIYDAVFDGSWTYEYFYDLIKDTYRDDDGSGDKSEGDFYGLIQGHYDLSSWMYGFDNPIVAKDEDGVPQIVLKSDKVNSIVSTIYDLCYNTRGVFYEREVEGGESMFLEKKSIFAFTSINSLMGEGFRNFEDEYGVLPVPKWNESQKGYYTNVAGEHTVTAIPKTAKDLEFIGTIAEALAAESYKQVTPTYYEIALKTRYLRDNESKRVLDLIIDGRCYDFGYIFNGWKATLSGSLERLMEDGGTNFESFYQNNYPASRLQYKAVLKAFDRLG